MKDWKCTICGERARYHECLAQHKFFCDKHWREHIGIPQKGEDNGPSIRSRIKQRRSKLQAA